MSDDRIARVVSSSSSSSGPPIPIRLSPIPILPLPHPPSDSASISPGRQPDAGSSQAQVPPTTLSLSPAAVIATGTAWTPTLGVDSTSTASNHLHTTMTISTPSNSNATPSPSNNIPSPTSARLVSSPQGSSSSSSSGSSSTSSTSSPLHYALHHKGSSGYATNGHQYVAMESPTAAARSQNTLPPLRPPASTAVARIISPDTPSSAHSTSSLYDHDVDPRLNLHTQLSTRTSLISTSPPDDATHIKPNVTSTTRDTLDVGYAHPTTAMRDDTDIDSPVHTYRSPSVDDLPDAFRHKLTFKPSTWKFSLRFPDPVAEFHFLHFYQPKALYLVRLLIILVCIINALAGITDIWVYKESVRPVIWIIRYTCITPVCVIMFYFTKFEKHFERHRQLSTSLYVLVIGGALIAISAEGKEPNHGIYIVLFYCASLFLCLRYFVSTCVNWIIFIAFNVSNYYVTWVARDESLQWKLSFGYLLLTLLMLMIACYFMEASVRSAYIQEVRLHQEQHKTNVVLYNILPKEIAQNLVRGIRNADNYPSASVLFCDIYDFKTLTSVLPAKDLVTLMNDIFSAFDQLTDSHEVLKIETIGEVYMVASGLPRASLTHCVALCSLALEMIQVGTQFYWSAHDDRKIQVRIGIHTGEVIAGVIGVKLPRYRLFGDTVNTASRMQSTCISNHIQISEPVYKKVSRKFECQDRGRIPVKGKGDMQTYFLLSRYQQDHERDAQFAQFLAALNIRHARPTHIDHQHTIHPNTQPIEHPQNNNLLSILQAPDDDVEEEEVIMENPLNTTSPSIRFRHGHHLIHSTSSVIHTLAHPHPHPTPTPRVAQLSSLGNTSPNLYADQQQQQHKKQQSIHTRPSSNSITFPNSSPRTATPHGAPTHPRTTRPVAQQSPASSRRSNLPPSGPNSPSGVASSGSPTSSTHGLPPLASPSPSHNRRALDPSRDKPPNLTRTSSAPTSSLPDETIVVGGGNTAVDKALSSGLSPSRLRGRSEHGTAGSVSDSTSMTTTSSPSGFMDHTGTGAPMSSTIDDQAEWEKHNTELMLSTMQRRTSKHRNPSQFFSKAEAASLQAALQCQPNTPSVVSTDPTPFVERVFVNAGSTHIPHLSTSAISIQSTSPSHLHTGRRLQSSPPSGGRSGGGGSGSGGSGQFSFMGRPVRQQSATSLATITGSVDSGTTTHRRRSSTRDESLTQSTAPISASSSTNTNIEHKSH